MEGRSGVDIQQIRPTTARPIQPPHGRPHERASHRPSSASLRRANLPNSCATLLCVVLLAQGGVQGGGREGVKAQPTVREGTRALAKDAAVAPVPLVLGTICPRIRALAILGVIEMGLGRGKAGEEGQLKGTRTNSRVGFVWRGSLLPDCGVPSPLLPLPLPPPRPVTCRMEDGQRRPKRFREWHNRHVQMECGRAGGRGRKARAKWRASERHRRAARAQHDQASAETQSC